MAPVCVADRLLLLLCFVLLLFLILNTGQIESRVVYDRQSLLNLQQNASDLGVFDHAGQNTLPPFLARIPSYLYRDPALVPRRRRYRRRGRRGGRLAKLKIRLISSSPISRAEHGLFAPFVVSRRFLDPIGGCLVPVFGSSEGPRPLCAPLRLSQCGVNHRLLRTMPRAPRSTGSPAPAPARIGLVNARSLANKTFILRDFFSSRRLDFLCITETWIGAGQNYSTLIHLLFPCSSSLVSGRKHVNGVDLYYEQTGRGKHAVLLFPGVFDCTPTCYIPQRESLSKERFTLVAWDPRGYPPVRDFPPDFLERDAQDGVDLMKGLGFDKLSLLGWSAGGTTALIAAAKNPDLIRQMVVLGAFPMFTQQDRQHFEEVHDVNRADQRLRAHLEAIYGEEEFLRIWGAFLKGTAKFAERPQGSVCLELLPLIKCPTLIINGDNDSVCHLYHPHALLKNIKGSRFHLVPGGRHNLHLAHPDLFNKLVEDFLED